MMPKKGPCSQLVFLALMPSAGQLQHWSLDNTLLQTKPHVHQVAYLHVKVVAVKHFTIFMWGFYMVVKTLQSLLKLIEIL